MLSDANQRYQMVEKNVGTNANKQFDAILQQTNQRHTAKIDMMQQQIDNLRAQLDDKQSELHTYDIRYKELQRSREALLIEKAETINQLSRTIDESQRQCQQLMANKDAAIENEHLRTKIIALERQTQDMQKTINNLTNRLEQSTQHSEQQLNTIESPSQFGKMNRPMIVGSTPYSNHCNTNANYDHLETLKSELNRCITSQNEKRDEIKRLEQQLLCKNDEIKRLKDDENKALVEMMLHKNEATKLSIKLKATQNQLENVTKNCSSTESSNRMPHTNQSYVELNETNHRLQSKIDDIEQKYNDLQNDYDNLSRQLNHVTDERNQATEKLHKYLMENDNLRQQLANSTNPSDMLHDIKMELEKEKFLLADAKAECERLKNLYCEVCSAKDQISRELADLRKIDAHKELYVQREKVVSLERAVQLCEMKCSELKKMLDREKLQHQQAIQDIQQQQQQQKSSKTDKDEKNLTNTCSRCISQITEIAKFEIENLQLQNSCSNYLKEINELRLLLDQSKATIGELQQKSVLKEEHDHLLTELKHKATQFEHFIRQKQNNSHSSMSPPSPPTTVLSSKPKITSRDQSCSTSPELLSSHSDKSFEKKIREESAKMLAVKLKSIEDQYKCDITELKENVNGLRRDLDETHAMLQIRTSEVQILKKAILSERDKITDILNHKDNETKSVLDKQNEILRKLHNDLNNAQEKIQYLSKELDERREQYDAELNSMQKLLDHRLDENKILRQSENQLKGLLATLKNDHSKVVEQLNAKYQSAKKTAANYKVFIEI